MQTTHKRTATSDTCYRVEGVPRHVLPDVWPTVAPLLDRALARSGDDITIDDVARYIDSGRCMLWLVKDTGLVAALVMHLPDDRDSLLVWLMGGKDFREWEPEVAPLLQRYAREHGRRYVEAYCRPGLSKLLRRSGWRPRTTLMALESER